jgi:type II secretory pathway pseudopilin PulG
MSHAEILVVLALVATAILSMMPFLRTFVHRSRLDAAAQEIEMTILSARLQAVKRGTNVGVWISTRPSTRAYRTLVVFVDSNANGVLDINEPVIGTYPLPPETSSIQLRIDSYNSQTPTTAPGDYNLAFSLFGSAVVSGAPGATLGVFILDDHGNVIQVGVPATVTGQVAMTKLDQAATSAPFYVTNPWTWY